MSTKLTLLRLCDDRAIVDYLKLKSGPSADYIISPEDLVPYLAHLERLETFEHGLFAIIVGVFPPSNDASQESGVYGAAAQTFHEVAKVFDVAKFFYTDNPGFAKHFNIKVSKHNPPY